MSQAWRRLIPCMWCWIHLMMFAHLANKEAEFNRLRPQGTEPRFLKSVIPTF